MSQERALHALAAANRHAPGAAAIRRDPFAAVIFAHMLQERCCDLLEALADALPDRIDRRAAAAAEAFLQVAFPAQLAVENDVLLPALLGAAEGDKSLCWALQQARVEHAVDEEHARELADLIAAADGAVRRPDALGYLLRGFFESQRRHISWEQTVLFPLARTAMSQRDLGRLADAVLDCPAWQQASAWTPQSVA